MKPRVELSIEELAERVGVPVRTIRFYISEGLLPGPEGRGRAATYGEGHLVRLRLVRRLAEQHVPLADIGERLSELGLEDVRALLAEEERRRADLQRAAAAPSPKAYVSALLSRAQAGRQAGASLRAPQFSRLQEEPAKYALPEPQTGTWVHWKLAPGVELHVRADAQSRERSLIERLLRVAGSSPQRRRPGREQ